MKMALTVALSLVTGLSVNARGAMQSGDLSASEGREVLCRALNKMHLNSGADVWPGYDPLETPILAKFSDGIFGFGDLSDKKDWEKESIGSCGFYSAPNGFQPPSSPIVPYFDVKGTNAFFFDLTITPKLSSWLLSALIHERFHRYQWEHFPYIIKLLSSKFTAFASVDAVAEAFIENKRLTSYLSLNDKRSLLEFVAVSRIRESILSTDESADWELGQQIAEGTATYVQLASMKAIESDFGLSFEKTWKEHLVADLSQDQGVDGVIKWRHYALGGIVFDFLDRRLKSKSWTVEIQNALVPSVYRLLLPYLSENEASLLNRGQAIFKSGEGSVALTNANSMISDYQSEIKRLTEQIASSPFEVSIEVKGNIHCSGGGVSRRAYYLPQGGTLSSGYSGSTTCDGGTFILNFINVPILLVSANGESRFGVDHFKIWIDGKVVSDLPQGDSQFSSLKLESEVMNLQISAKGVVNSNGSAIQVRF